MVPGARRAVGGGGVEATVVAQVYLVGDVGVPGHGVLVGVHAAVVVGEGAARVGRRPQAQPGHEHVVAVLGIDEGLGEPPAVDVGGVGDRDPELGLRLRRRSEGRPAVAGDEPRLEGASGIVGVVHIDVLVVLGIDGDADSAVGRIVGGKAAGRRVGGRGQLGPGGPAIGGLPHPGADTGVGAVVRNADVVPHPRDQHPGVGRVDGQVAGAGGSVGWCQRLGPGRAAVVADVDAALMPGEEQVPRHRHPDLLGIAGVDHDAGDGPGVVQADLGPALPTVGGFPHAAGSCAGVVSEGITRHATRPAHSPPGERTEPWEKNVTALLFSCLGRGAHLFGRPDHDTDLFRAKVGAVPLGGFFCNGEIGPVGGATFLHGYTSAFALFREAAS